MKPEDITAWALDELTPEERAQIEAALAGSPTVKKQAVETKAFCHLLSEHLVDEDAALTSEQRNSLKALSFAEAENVVPFTKEEAPARMNGKAFHAKVTAARERTEPKSSPWMRIAALAACLMFVMVVINQSRKVSPTPQVTLAEKAAPRTGSYDVLVSSPKAAGAEQPVKVAQAAAASLPKSTLGGEIAATGSVSQGGKDKSKPVNEALIPSSPLAANLAKNSSSTLTLPGVNTYTGGMTVNGGTIASTRKPSAMTVQTEEWVDLNRPKLASSESKSFTAQPGSVPASSTAAASGAPASSVRETVKTKSDATARDHSRAKMIAEVNADWEEKQYPAPQIPGIITMPRQPSAPGTESYAKVVENPFQTVQSQPLSTFSIDVDTASYANVRRFLNEGRLPPPDAVRLEELINYFPYDYEQPGKDQPFSVQVDVAEAPWAPQHRLARVAIKGRDVGQERKTANFVFLVDVSGSMSSSERLPLVKQGLEMLTEQLREDDRVSIVTYAGACAVALESTTGNNKATIMGVIRGLHAGGSTNGESGINLAYQQAEANFIKDGINRVILCTDGDFNVGISDPQQLEKLIKEKAKGGTFLSVLGYGTGNLKDRTMEALADNGNGNYAYIDSLGEARKVLVEQMHGTLITIAKDVKIQVEFNPAVVASYRLIGYEKRMLAAQDFNNDKKDAGEIGAGHTITALYELIPVGLPMQNGALASVDPLRYQQKKPEEPKTAPMLNARSPQEKLEGINDETMTVKLRYKEPDGQLSKLIEVPVRDSHKALKDSPRDLRFATAIAGFGMLLRGSEHAEEFTFDAVRKLALSGKGEDALGYRGEFIQLVDKAKGLKMTGQR